MHRIKVLNRDKSIRKILLLVILIGETSNDDALSSIKRRATTENEL